jgi:K+-transporting ATPase ATPase A chain
MHGIVLTGAAVLTLAALLAVCHVPLGTWLYRVFTDDRDWKPERLVYRLVGVDARTEQTWTRYAVSAMSFALVSIGALFLLIMAQHWLPWSQDRTMHWHTALNTAVSFVTNTNWQSYAGEAGAGYVVQAAGLTVQNFASAAMGLAVAVALVRGIARSETDRIGNFWVDLVRGVVRVLLPLASVAAVVLMIGGVIQNFTDPFTVTTLSGGSQVVQGGPVASQEAIKILGTNGGGFFNANSAHPFENPNAWTNLFQIFLLLLIPFSLPYTFGLMVGRRRQALVLAATMGTLLTAGIALAAWTEYAAASGPLGSMEGKEQRFGPTWSAVFAAATTGTSTGAVNSMHSSYSPLGGGVALAGMMLGEVSPGGVGTGLYNLLLLTVLTVFIAGLMVGRTPELLGKAVGRREITIVALSVLATPALVLLGTGVAIVLPEASAALLNDGPHGLTEMMYAYTSASNNNGSAFAGLAADQPFLNLSLAGCMVAGRFVTIVLVLALAGSFAAQRQRPVTPGTMPTDTPLFTVLLIGTVVVVAGLTFFPAFALGPVAEALS